MRPSIEEYMMSIAKLTATRGTCRRRQVGAVITDIHNRILSTGYNGSPREAVHCIDSPCPGSDLPSGQGLEYCNAIHAEQNAVVSCANLEEAYAIYVTASPCESCLKLLMSTNIEVIYAHEPYPNRMVDEWTKLKRRIYYEKR